MEKERFKGVLSIVLPANWHSVCSESGVGLTSDRKQVQDISAKFWCEVARNGKVKKSEFYPL